MLYFFQSRIQVTSEGLQHSIQDKKWKVLFVGIVSLNEKKPNLINVTWWITKHWHKKIVRAWRYVFIWCTYCILWWLYTHSTKYRICNQPVYRSIYLLVSKYLGYELSSFWYNQKSGSSVPHLENYNVTFITSRDTIPNVFTNTLTHWLEYHFKLSKIKTAQYQRKPAIIKEKVDQWNFEKNKW